MPAKGYVNVATSLRVKDAYILRQKLAELGFSSLHSFLKTFINGEKTVFTSKLTSKTETEKPQNGLVLPNQADYWWAGRDLNSRPSACQADVLTKLDDRPNRS